MKSNNINLLASLVMHLDDIIYSYNLSLFDKTMLRLRADGKLQKATPKVRSSTNIYNSLSRATPQAVNVGRYGRHEP